MLFLLRQNRTLGAAPSNTTKAAADKQFDFPNLKGIAMAVNETLENVWTPENRPNQAPATL